MKKLITSIIALIVCATGANAATEFDLSGMSLDELIALQQQVQMAMWETDEWQEVEVPAGIYEIGVDIPAGRWSITATYDTNILYGSSLDEYGSFNYKDHLSGCCLVEGQDTVMNLVDGCFLFIDLSPVIFSPYSYTSLGFE